MRKLLKWGAVLAAFALLAACFLGCDSGGGSSSSDYTVTWNTDNGSTAPAPTKVASGGTVTLPAEPTKSGFTFGGWYTEVNGGGTQFTAATKVTKSLTVYAKWIAAGQSVKITYNVNIPTGFTGVAFTVDDKNITKGQAITSANLPDLTKDGNDADLADFGLKFLGWYSEATGGTKINASDTFNADTTIYAHWESFDPDTEVVVQFSYNYSGAPEDLVKVVAIGASVTPFPEDPTRSGTIKGKDTDNDTWAFKGWKQYEAGTGNTYTAASTFSASITIYAAWEPSTGWPPDVPAPSIDLEGAEKITLRNGHYAIFRFELPAGKKWSDYSGISADFLFGPEAWDFAQGSRGHRIAGNYKLTDFSNTVIPSDGALDKFMCADMNASGMNAGHLINQQSSDWETVSAFVNGKKGLTAVPWEWFTIDYDTTGTKAHTDFIQTNVPAAADTGPFYFGVGFSGAQGGTTQWIRNVKLVGATGTASVVATPLYFKNGSEVLPVFLAHTSSTGNGVDEIFRAPASGTVPNSWIVDVTPAEVVLTLKGNYDGAPADVTRTISTGTALVADDVAVPGTFTGPANATFVKWTINANGTGGDVGVGTILSAATTVFAQWAAPITITFDPDNGGATSTESIGAGTALGDLLNKHILFSPSKDVWTDNQPVKAGYHFTGWYTAKTAGTKVTATTTFAAAATVYAVWEDLASVTSTNLGYELVGTLYEGNELMGKHVLTDDNGFITTAGTDGVVRLYVANNSGGNRDNWGIGRIGAVEYKGKAGTSFWTDAALLGFTDTPNDGSYYDAPDVALNAYNDCAIYKIEVWKKSNIVLTWTEGSTISVNASGNFVVDGADFAELVAMKAGSYIIVSCDVSGYGDPIGYGFGNVTADGGGTPQGLNKLSAAGPDNIKITVDAIFAGTTDSTKITLNSWGGAKIISVTFWALD